MNSLISLFFQIIIESSLVLCITGSIGFVIYIFVRKKGLSLRLIFIFVLFSPFIYFSGQTLPDLIKLKVNNKLSEIVYQDDYLERTSYAQHQSSSSPVNTDALKTEERYRKTIEKKEIIKQEHHPEKSLSFDFIVNIVKTEIVLAWAVCFLFFLIRSIYHSIYFLKSVKEYKEVNDPDIFDLYFQCACLMKVKNTPELLYSHKHKSPFICGFLNQKIILPEDVLIQRDMKKLKYIFLHELIHKKRHDQWWELIENISKILFFFHPVVFWMSNKLREEREYTVDKIVVNSVREKKPYALFLFDYLRTKHTDCRGIVISSHMASKEIVKRLKRLAENKGISALSHVLNRTGSIALVILLSLFIIILSITMSCTGRSIEREYHESDITEQIGHLEHTCMAVSPDNELVIFQLGEYDSVKNQQGTSRFLFLNKEGDIVRKVDYDYQVYLRDFTLDSQGRFYVLGIEDIPKILILDSSGRIINEIELANLIDLNSCDIKVSSEGIVYLANKMGIRIVSSDKTREKYLTRGNYSGVQMTFDEKDNLIVTYRRKYGNKEEYRIEKWDTKDQTKIWEKSKDKGLYSLYFNRKNQKLYVLDSAGIRVWNNEGRPGNCIFDSEPFNLNSKALYYGDLYVESDYIFLSLYQAGKKTVLRYSLVTGYEKDRRSEIAITISPILCSSILSSTFIENCIKSFGDQNESVKIKVQEYIPPKEVEKRAKDVMNDIATSLMTGTGPDIISLRSRISPGSMPLLPLHKIAEKDVFADLELLMKENPDFNMSEYNENIIQGCRINGRLILLPINFYFPVIVANEGILEEKGISIDMERLAEEYFIDIIKRCRTDIDGDGDYDIYGLQNISGTLFFKEFILYPNLERYIDYRGKKAGLDNAHLANLLDRTKELVDEQYFYPFTDMKKNIEAWENNLIALKIFSVNIYNMYSIFRNTLNSDSFSYFYPESLDGNRKFSSEYLFAINNKSPKKEAAWKFLKHMISEEMQKNEYMHPLMANKAAQEHQIKKESQPRKGMISVRGKDGTSRKIIDIPLNKERADYMRNMINELNVLSCIDPVIDKIIEGELVKYFKGERSAGKALKIIQDKVSTYLNE